jgi:diguanylate cyclase (GGDEF)-like protein
MKKLSSYLVQIASPGFIPDSAAIIVGYLAILAIFPLDIITGSRVSFHILYVIPLTLIALHCSKSGVVTAAVVLSVTVQALTLLTFSDDTDQIKLFLFGMILLSDTVLVLVARFARFNILEAERLSTTDPLTRLSNRRALEVAMNLEMTRQKRYGGQFSLVLIDLDGFKSVNDTLGHHAGDTALVLLADILRENTRQSDMVFRIGGDEFVVLMPNTEVEDCERICNAFCKLIAEKMQKASFQITASIGYTTIERVPEHSVDILTIADKAMYAAKTSGKSRVVRGYDTSVVAA